jgi:translocator protein
MPTNTALPTNSNELKKTGSPLTQWQYINAASYLFNILITYGIGTAGWFNRPNNAELSDKYQTIVTPSGYAFSIWGIIFIAQAVWVVTQVVLKQYRDSEFISRVGYNYMYVCLAQIGWTIFFSFEIMEAALIMMYAILYFLWRIVTALNFEENKCVKTYMMWKFPFSIHFGWILAASAVNTSLMFVDYNASAKLQVAVGVISIIILTALGIVFAQQRDFTIPLVIMWASYAIYSELKAPKPQIVGNFTSKQIDMIQYGSLIAMSILAVAVVVMSVMALRNRRSS